MAWSAPKTWAGTEVLTSADMNTYVRDNLDYLFDSTPISTGWMNQGTLVSQSNQRIESGTKYVAIANTTYGSAAVTFNTAFGTAPRVVMTECNLGNANCRALTVGTGGFTGYVFNGSGGTTTGSAIFNWMAIGA